MQKLKADNTLLLIVLGLLIFGLVMITSIGVPKSIQLTAPDILYPNCNDSQVDCYYLFKNHLVRMMVGLAGLLIVSKISHRFWRKSAVFFYAATLVLLLVVLFAGSQFTTFAKSWIVLFNTSVQPSEFAKLALIFYLAHWLERKNQDIETFQFGFIPFCIVTGVLALPILLQPDLGSTLVITGVAVTMYFVAGARLRHLALGSFIALLVSMLIIGNVSRVNDRFQAFMNQDANCREDYCWQTEQANIAVGTGGFWGKGLTQGVQKSYWLPQASDDFIFAASAEELGFIRIVLVVIAYGFIGWRGFIIATNAPDKFTMLTASGITSWITLQAFMNISINIGLMPVTGLTLPFISYGGSSLVASLLGIGVLLQISKYSRTNARSTYRRGNRRSYSTQYSPYSGA